MHLLFISAVFFFFFLRQIKDEGFLEDINNILSSGTVPNLFGRDDIPGILDAVRKPAVQAGVEDVAEHLWSFFIDRVRSNLHVVLAMSPIGDSLRNRCRMYPGLVNCTTIGTASPLTYLIHFCPFANYSHFVYFCSHGRRLSP